MKMLRNLALLLCLLTTLTLQAASTVNLNTADPQTLAASLTGVGEKKAEAIVAYREANGPFLSIEQLTEVDGIGDNTLELNRERITLSDE